MHPRRSRGSWCTRWSRSTGATAVRSRSGGACGASRSHDRPPRSRHFGTAWAESGSFPGRCITHEGVRSARRSVWWIVAHGHCPARLTGAVVLRPLAACVGRCLNHGLSERMCQITHPKDSAGRPSASRVLPCTTRCSATLRTGPVAACSATAGLVHHRRLQCGWRGRDPGRERRSATRRHAAAVRGAIGRDRYRPGDALSIPSSLMPRSGPAPHPRRSRSSRRRPPPGMTVPWAAPSEV